MQLRAYASILVATLFLGCVIYLSSELVLYRSNETMNEDELINRQLETDGLYFGIARPIGSYKLAVYAMRKPDIVILGSSRAHRQHQEFYNRSTYSMSGSVVTTDHAIQVLDILVPIHKPQYVVYNLDFYSLCRLTPFVGNLSSYARPIGPPRGGIWQQTNRFAVVPKLIARRAISLQEAANFAFGRFESSFKGVRLYGLIAITKHFGFRRDGAVSDVDATSQDRVQFESAKQDIIRGAGHYPAGCLYDPTAVANLEFLRQDMDRAGIKLIIVMPPIAPVMYRLFMAAPDEISGYYKEWAQESAKRHFPDLHDLVDGSLVGAPDSEFSEEVHGGDVSEARMLLKAAQAPGTALAEIINRPFLQRLIQERAGTVGLEMSYFQAADVAVRDLGGTAAVAPP